MKGSRLAMECCCCCFGKTPKKNKGYCRLNGEAIFSHLCSGKCMCGGDATEKDALDGAKLDLFD